MPAQSFYDVLGVSSSATDAEIRTAYRKLARELHPDVNKAPDAAKKFDQVQKAYDVLSDAAKRRAYDQYGEAMSESGDFRGGRPGGRGARSGTYSWSNVGQPGGQGAAFDMDATDISEMMEAMFGGMGTGRAGASETGSKGRARSGTRKTRAPREAEPLVRDLEIPFSMMLTGGIQTLRADDGSGTPRTIEVKVPRAVEEGAQLRVRNAVGTRDLLLNVRVQPHARLRRGGSDGVHTGKGLDLFLEVPISIADALIGGVAHVPTTAGEVELTIPAGTDAGRRMRLRGRGLTDDAGQTGDLYAVMKIVVPKVKLSPEEQAMLRAIASRGSEPA